MFTTIPARNLQTSYKDILKSVKTKKRPVILTTNDGPQAALVSLEDLEKLKNIHNKQTAVEMLALALQHKDELKKLPANLRNLATDILYSKL